MLTRWHRDNFNTHKHETQEPVMIKKYLKKHLRTSMLLQKSVGIFIVIIVASIGILLLSNSHASSPYVAGSAANGTLGGGAALGTNGSGGSSVVFGSNGVKTIPTSITSNCSSDVSSPLNAWLATVPDGSVIDFPSGACYGIDSSLLLTNRNNLTINGNGGQVKLLTTVASSASHLSVWDVNGGSNISFENMTLTGDNPTTSSDGTSADCNPDGVWEWQYGIDFEGTQTGAVNDVNINKTCGDFVEAEPYEPSAGNYDFADYAKNITITGGTFTQSGRQGIGLTDVDYATVKGVTIQNVAQDAVDVETDVTQEVDQNITVENSTFSSISGAVLSNGGAGGFPNVGGMTVENNTETNTVNCYPMVWLSSNASTPTRAYYTITGNHFAPYVELAQFDSSVTDVSITNNTDSGAYGNGGCGQSYGLEIDAAMTNATIENNDFGPTVTELANITDFSGITICSNKDETTSSFNLPTVCAN
jgi:hypothetical protein